MMKPSRTLSLAVFLGVCFAPRSGATVYNSNGSAANIQFIHDTQAVDGDTITLPAGNFSWTTHIDISKGITLRGQTTINGAGTSNPVVGDYTIVRDNSNHITNQLGLVWVTLNPTQSFRMTGITFRKGQSTAYGTNGAIRINSTGNQPVTSARIDHCHFDHLYWEDTIWILGWVYGVEDHNLIECNQAGLSHMIWHNTWGGEINGNGSWADFPYYGTQKFWFIETNTIRGNGPQTSAKIDCVNGGRYVARHNFFSNSSPGGHGTEGGPQRGCREREVYDNAFNYTIGWGSGLQRSGGGIWHDNSWIGQDSDNQSHTSLSVFREFGAIGNDLSRWGLAGGNSPWDVNDDHGVYESGTTSATLAHGLLRDSSKNWTTNQWTGYSVTNNNPLAACYLHSSYIISNTSNTITYYYYGSGDRGAPLLFNAGDTYQIYRALIALDQNGRGKGDLVIMTTGPNPIPINSLTGTQSWTHENLEPCFSWNNVHTPTGHVYGFYSEIPTEIANRDYYNVGAGFPPDTTPQQVINTYTAALNGVNYTGPYIYPHPLTSNGLAQPGL
jgi:hypothetical protein